NAVQAAGQGTAEDAAHQQAAEAAAAPSQGESGEKTQADTAGEYDAPTMAQYDETFITPNQGDIVRGKVVQVSSDEVLVHVGGKSEGRIPRHELGLKGDQEPADIL